MSNNTILERNTLAGFEHEDTQMIYLRGSQRDEILAFRMADEWQKHLKPFFDFMREYLESLSSPSIVDEVIEFIKERHFRRYFPNQ